MLSFFIGIRKNGYKTIPFINFIKILNNIETITNLKEEESDLL